MKKGALAKHLLNTTINTALRDDVPKRTIRNLVELGENFPSDASSTIFLEKCVLC